VAVTACHAGGSEPLLCSSSACNSNARQPPVQACQRKQAWKNNVRSVQSGRAREETVIKTGVLMRSVVAGPRFVNATSSCRQVLACCTGRNRTLSRARHEPQQTAPRQGKGGSGVAAGNGRWWWRQAVAGVAGRQAGSRLQQQNRTGCSSSARARRAAYNKN